MKVTLSRKTGISIKQQIKEQIQKAASSSCEGRAFCSPIDQLTSSTPSDSDSDFAMILPIDSSKLFKEFVIGSRVKPEAAVRAVQALQKGGVQCGVRVLAPHP